MVKYNKGGIMEENQKKTIIRYKRIQIEELTENMKKTFNKMLMKSLNSGALTEEMLEDNYLLVKAIIDIWCTKRPFRAFSDITRREFANLSHFI